MHNASRKENLPSDTDLFQLEPEALADPLALHWKKIG
jgi:hypothetical protein